MNQPHECGCFKGRVRNVLSVLAAKKYGWDGEQALPLREDVVTTMLTVFSPSFPVCFGDLADPTAELCYDGTVELVFAHGSRELILLFQCLNVIQFLTRNEATGMEMDGVFRINDPQGVLDLQASVEWLAGDEL